MLNSKQRSLLRARSNRMETIMQIGKGGITENLLATVSDALEARELIKLRVLENSPESARAAADEIAQAVGADVVSVVGTRFVLYRKSKKNKHLEI